jgi:hypothetical protein
VWWVLGFKGAGELADEGGSTTEEFRGMVGQGATDRRRWRLEVSGAALVPSTVSDGGRQFSQRRRLGELATEAAAKARKACGEEDEIVPG